MTINPIINFAIRGFQGLCAIIILGLSVDLIKGHKWGDLPATLGFAAFAAGLSIVGVIIGVAATWVEILQGIIGAAIDGLVAIINLVAGVVSLNHFVAVQTLNLGHVLTYSIAHCHQAERHRLFENRSPVPDR
jgi:hypothetical protein